MNDDIEDYLAKKASQIEGHLWTIKWLLVLLIATVVYPPVAVACLILSIIVLFSAAIGAGIGKSMRRFRD